VSPLDSYGIVDNKVRRLTITAETIDVVRTIAPSSEAFDGMVAEAFTQKELLALGSLAVTAQPAHPTEASADVMSVQQDTHPDTEGRHRFRQFAAGVALVASVCLVATGCKSGSVTAAPTPTEQSCSSTSTANLSYYWAGGSQFVQATGMSAAITQEQPSVVVTPNNPYPHSNGQLWFGTKRCSGNVVNNGFDMGWQVNPYVTGNILPDLLVGRWVDGVACYVDCGFVSTPNSIQPNDPVEVGKVGTYKILYTSEDGGKWQFFYNDKLIGYFPESIWDGTFTVANSEYVYDEVETSGEGKDCAQMGNGKYGTSPGSEAIRDYTLYGTQVQPDLQSYVEGYSVSTANGTFVPGQRLPQSEVNTLYNLGDATKTSMDVGGPGYCGS